MMTMKPEELRQLRSWAVGTVIQTRLESGQKPVNMTEVIREARKLVNFVRGN